MTTRAKKDMELIEDTFGYDLNGDDDLVGYLMWGIEEMLWDVDIQFCDARHEWSPYKTGIACIVNFWIGSGRDSIVVSACARKLEDALFKAVAKACKKFHRRNK